MLVLCWYGLSLFWLQGAAVDTADGARQTVVPALVHLRSGKEREWSAFPTDTTNQSWQAVTFGCSGAVWIDIDEDGRATSAREYAERIVASAGQDWPKLVAECSAYDETVAAHVAFLVDRAGSSLQDESLLVALKQAQSAVQSGFQAYREAARENELARDHP